MRDDAHDVLRNDPVMADLLDRHEPYSEANWGEFERLSINIINQQLSTASAAAVKERVFDVLGGDVTPERVLAADEDALRDAGLSNAKVDYLQNAAAAFQENDFTKEGMAHLSDEEVVDQLTNIRGVGEWTARMYLLFVLERQDVLPLGDLAIRNGIKELYGDGDGMTREEMRDIAAAWRPYRSVATRYIWAEYESDR
jgi:DNA-3-methyladenine glycosylase II